MRQVKALWPKRLYPNLQAPGSLPEEALADVHRALARLCPSPEPPQTDKEDAAPSRSDDGAALHWVSRP